MTNTNTWSSKAWFNAGKEHFNNAKSSLPEVNKQTGINFTISAGTFAAHKYEITAAKIPGNLAAAPVQAVVDAGKWAANKIGERTAVENNTNSEDKVKINYLDHEGEKSTVSYMYNKNEYQMKKGTIQSINNRDNKPKNSPELTDILTKDQLQELDRDGTLSFHYYNTTNLRLETKNNETKDWQAV